MNTARCGAVRTPENVALVLLQINEAQGSIQRGEAAGLALDRLGRNPECKRYFASFIKPSNARQTEDEISSLTSWWKHVL